jgi:uroporphyrinogen decarboxylase
MTNPQRLRTLLDGGVPDRPPHWELVFQIPEPMFGLDRAHVANAAYGSDAARQEALLGFHAEVAARLVDACGWAAVPAADAYSPAAVTHLRHALGDAALVPGYEGGGVFHMPNGANMMDFAVMLYERSDELHAEARRKCEAAKEHLGRLRDAGADFFVLTYDFGFNNAPFIAPRQFATLCAPFLAELAQEAHDLGRVAILHSDGCLTQILDQIHATGIDGYQSVDPQGHMDIAAVRAQYPDWLLMGNVPCSLLQDTDEPAIREAVRYCVTHGGIGSRYIFSTSNCIFAGMPPESYRVMLDEYQALLAAA